MHHLLLMLALAGQAAQADDLTAYTDDEDLDDDLDWDDDGSRPDSDGGEPDDDPTWDVDEDDIPIDMDADPDIGSVGGSELLQDASLEEDPEWDVDSPEDAALGEEEPPPMRAAARKPVRPVAVGRTPLADNYPIEVVSTDLESVVIELPVLISQRRAELSGEFWLIGEIYLDGSKVSESRALITPAGATEDSPSFVWIKAQAPAAEAAGTVEIRMSRQEVGGASSDLFTTRTDYKL